MTSDSLTIYGIKTLQYWAGIPFRSDVNLPLIPF